MNEKEKYYFQRALAGSKEQSLLNLQQHQNSLQSFEYDVVKAHINTHFLPPDASKGEPIQWQWNSPTDFPKVNWTCRQLGICPGPITILCAFVNVGKTLFAVDLAVCVANGLKLFDCIDVQRPGKIMHVDFEAGNTLSKIYYQRILNGHNIANFNNISYWQPSWRLDQLQQAEIELTEKLKGHSLCLIDCLSAGIPSTKQNEEGARAPIDMLNKVSEATGCSIVLLHHEPKEAAGDNPLKSVKGTGGFIGAAGNSLHLKRDFGSDVCKIILGKSRFGTKFEMFYSMQNVGDFIEDINNTMGCKFMEHKELTEEQKEQNLSERILRLVLQSPGINKTALRFQIEGNNKEIDACIKDMLTCDDPLLRSEVCQSKGNPVLHFITDAGMSYLSYSNQREIK